MGSSYLPASKEFYYWNKGTQKFLVNSPFKYSADGRKAALPRRDEKPIMGLKTSKNYILANKVENMLARN